MTAIRDLVSPPARVDVIVLAYGVESLLRDCVEAILGSIGVELHLFVVDNGASAAIRTLPQNERLSVVRPDYNTGFAGGCNLGAAAGTASHLVFLNSDAIVRPDAIAKLVDGLNDPTIGLVTGCVLLPDEQHATARAGGPVADRELVNAAGNPVHWLGFSWCGGYGEPRTHHLSTKDVASISGAFFAIRRDDWTMLDGFDATYFTYHEDVDLSLRTWISGRRVTYVPEAVCVHHYEFSRNPTKTYLVERNRLITALTVPSAKTMRRLIVPLLFVQAMVLANAMTRADRASWLRATGWILAHPMTLLQRRRRINALRRVPDDNWIRLLSPTLNPPPITGFGVPPVVNSCLRTCHQWIAAGSGRRHFTFQRYRRRVQYLAAAALGTAADISVVFALRHAGLVLPIAVAAGWITSVSIGFIGNRNIVFRDSSRTDRSTSIRYLIVAALNALAAIGGVSALVAIGWPYPVARVVMSSTLIIFNYYMNKHWVFGVGQSDREVSPTDEPALDLTMLAEVPGATISLPSLGDDPQVRTK